MNDTAAHLVDRVLPFAPYRHWVLSLPGGLKKGRDDVRLPDHDLDLLYPGD